MALSFHINVTGSITSVPDAPAQRTKVPTFIGFHERFAERARMYSSLDDMLADGFTETDDLYEMVSAALDNPSADDGPLARWMIGRTVAPVANTQTINVVGTTDGIINLVDSFTGSDVTIASFTASGSTATQIRDGLLADLAASGYTGTVVDSDTFTVKWAEDGVTMDLSVTGAAAANLQLGTNVAGNGIDDDLDAIVAATVGDDTVGSQTHLLLIEPGLLGKGGIIMAQNWVHSQAVSSTGRGYVVMVQTNEAGLIDSGVTNSTASLLVALGKTRLVLAYRAVDTDPITAMAAGRVVPSEPGAVQWSWRTLTGSSLTGEISTTINTLLTTRRVSYAERFKDTGAVHFFGGRDATNVPINHYAAMDQWRDDMTAVVANALAGSTGIDMTNEAFEASFGSPIRLAMLGMVTAGRLAPGYTVSFTPMADIPLAEKQAGDYYTTGRITVTATLRQFAERIAMAGTFNI